MIGIKLELLLAALFCQFVSGQANVLRVPDELSTIQVALESTAHGDTVLVSPGIYHEFLTGPGHSFSLFGMHAPDSLNSMEWTVLDPIPPLEGDTASTFDVNADSVFLRNFVIVNSPELRQNVWPTRTGGIEYSGQYLSLTNCRFDSVSRAIRGGAAIRLDSCRFSGCLWWCVHPNTFGSVKARECYFDGRGFWLARSYSNSSYINCVFACNEDRDDLLSFAGTNIEIRGCKFGPCSEISPPLNGYTWGNCRVEYCEFIGISQAPSLLRVDMDCPGPDTLPIVIAHNVFRDFFVVSQQGIPAIELMCQDPQAGFFGRIEDNLIINGHGIAPAGIDARGSAYLEGNVLDSLYSGASANVKGSRGAGGDTLMARNNQFLGGGYAAQTDGMAFDARWNWWGDSSGPYNPSENPEGIGSEVGWGVEFFPWLLSPIDTTIDTNEVAADEHDLVVPAMFELRAFPNPFNATTMLEIEVARPGNYVVVLYDVSGRESARVFSGRIESRTTVRVDANKLASGVYFARLAGKEGILATEKLLLLK